MTQRNPIIPARRPGVCPVTQKPYEAGAQIEYTVFGWALVGAQISNDPDERRRLLMLAEPGLARRRRAQEEARRTEELRELQVHWERLDCEKAEQAARHAAEVAGREQMLAQYAGAMKLAGELLALVPAKLNAELVGAAVRIVIKSRGKEFLLLARPAAAPAWCAHSVVYTEVPGAHPPDWVRAQRAADAAYLARLIDDNPTPHTLWANLMSIAAHSPSALHKTSVDTALKYRGVRVVIASLQNEAEARYALYFYS
ncbi:hypothetical protein [Deinococcus sp. QL22]|uniref:hypothetical protein n=1 Tax=Deinococcus sp. QL22 TaxID=2939437 RepID=UPI002018282E|nr:hypothetical protein [Deinococcus sp. QL22]UQN06523.1 hypothetical protein M1R55_00975 [Deinococcus sp. QL22]